MWLSPFTCPQPPRHMVGSLFLSPPHTWLGRTAALALVPTDQAAIPPFKELKQSTAQLKKIKVASGRAG